MKKGIYKCIRFILMLCFFNCLVVFFLCEWLYYLYLVGISDECVLLIKKNDFLKL